MWDDDGMSFDLVTETDDGAVDDDVCYNFTYSFQFS